MARLPVLLLASSCHTGPVAQFLSRSFLVDYNVGVPPFLPQLTDSPDVTAGLSCCVR